MASDGCFAWYCFHCLMNLSAAISRFNELLQYGSLRHSQCFFIAIRMATSRVYCMSYGISILV